MNVIQALKEEELRLRRQLTAVQGALAALNGGSAKGTATAYKISPNGRGGKRTLSAEGRANIIRAAKARWAKIKAEKAKKAK